MGETKLFKDIIYQALEDLYSKKTRVKFKRAHNWLFNEFEEGTAPIINVDVACDLYGVEIDLIRMFAEAITAGKVPKPVFKEAIKEVLE